MRDGVVASVEGFFEGLGDVAIGERFELLGIEEIAALCCAGELAQVLLGLGQAGEGLLSAQIALLAERFELFGGLLEGLAVLVFESGQVFEVVEVLDVLFQTFPGLFIEACGDRVFIYLDDRIERDEVGRLRRGWRVRSEEGPQKNAHSEHEASKEDRGPRGSEGLNASDAYGGYALLGLGEEALGEGGGAGGGAELNGEGGGEEIFGGVVVVDASRETGRGDPRGGEANGGHDDEGASGEEEKKGESKARQGPRGVQGVEDPGGDGGPGEGVESHFEEASAVEGRGPGVEGVADGVGHGGSREA